MEVVALDVNSVEVGTTEEAELKGVVLLIGRVEEALEAEADKDT